MVYSQLPERVTAAILGLFLMALLGLRAVRSALGWQPTSAWFVVAALLFGFLKLGSSS